jgi:WD40 repeat protein
VTRPNYSCAKDKQSEALRVFKRLLAIIGLVCVGLAAWPVWADGSPAQPLGAGAPTAIAASPDGATLAVGTSVGVWFLSAANLAPVSFWDAGQLAPAVAYSTDGRYLRAGDRFYDLTTGLAMLLVPADLGWQPQSPAPEYDCSARARRCLVYQFDALIILDQDTQIDTGRLRTGRLLDAAWSPDGGTIYTLVASGVQAWDAASGTLKHSQVALFAKPDQPHLARRGREVPSVPHKQVKSNYHLPITSTYAYNAQRAT